MNEFTALSHLGESDHCRMLMSPTVTPNTLQRLDACIPTSGEVATSDRIRRLDFPGGTYGGIEHTGPFTTIDQAYRALADGIRRSRRYVFDVGPPVQIYRQVRIGWVPTANLTEVYFPTKSAQRVIPLFPELRPYLEKVRDEAQQGADALSSSPVITRFRDRNANLRTQLLRTIANAELSPWPKLFQNLRASRATELAAEYPGHVAAAWMGHSTKVAQKHYWQVTDADFDRAARTWHEFPGTLYQSPQQRTRGTKSGTVSHGQ